MMEPRYRTAAQLIRFVVLAALAFGVTYWVVYAVLSRPDPEAESIQNLPAPALDGAQ